MKKTIVAFLFFCIAMAALAITYYDYFPFLEKKEIHIAIIGPMSGSQASNGRTIVQGAELYLKQLNKRGGINNQKVILDIFDDQNNPDIARQKAREIINEKKALAVIGHVFSSCSISAGEVYKNRILAISPTSTNILVTDTNDWYFRTIFNDQAQGRYIADYIKNVLKQNRVSIIQEDEPYGSYLSAEFTKEAQRIGLEIKNQWTFSRNSKELDKDLQHIVFDLLTCKRSAGVIFLPVHASEGVKLIQLMRDTLINNTVFGADSLSTSFFVQGFKDLPKEKRKPGYYTDGVYATAHLLFDTANLEAQHFKEDFLEAYGEESGWQEATTYDAVALIVEAIKQAGIKNRLDTIDQDRKKIRDCLAGISKYDQAVKGVTGLNYFDEHGDAKKTVFVGVYQNNRLISAPTQFKSIPNILEFHKFSEALQQNQVKLFQDGYKAKINVVYSGVNVREIKSLDIRNLTFELDFNLWFRYQGDLDIGNIEFLNSVEPITLGKPVDKKVTDRDNYELYHVQGVFKADFLSGYNVFGQHTLGISFRHRSRTMDNLVYVADVIGMGITEANPLLKSLQSTQVFSPVYGWSADQVFFYQDLFPQHALGNPETQNVQDGELLFSRYNMGIQIKENTLSIRRIVPHEPARIIVIVSVLVLFLLLCIRWLWKVQQHYPALLWLVESISLLLLILASETLLFDWLKDDTDTYILETLKTIYDMCWWLIPSLLLIRAIECLLWVPLENKTRNAVPSIVRNLLSLTILLLALFSVAAFVFDQKITSLLATSGVLVMIIGLAIQVNLSNIFSGIAISIEQPFKIGDWIKVGDSEAAEVVEMTWRSVRLKNNCECMYSMPNSVVADAKVLNYNYPDDYYWLFFPVYVSSVHPPDKVMKVIMDGLLETTIVQRQMGPIVRMDYTDKGIAYYPVFLLKGYGSRAADKNAVSKNIWTHLNRAGMTPAVPRQEIHFTRGEVDRLEQAKTPFTILEEAAIFHHFPQTIKENLAQHTQQRFVPKGEMIFQQGDEASSMFVIAQGIVAIRELSDKGEDFVSTANLAPGGGVNWCKVVQEEGRKVKEVSRLGAGKILGEMGLLTGTARYADAVALSDCYLLEITKEVLSPMIHEHPYIGELFSDYIMELETSNFQREAKRIGEEEALSHAAGMKTIRQRTLNAIMEFMGKA